jgi:hypothetical protein
MAGPFIATVRCKRAETKSLWPNCTPRVPEAATYRVSQVHLPRLRASKVTTSDANLPSESGDAVPDFVTETPRPLTPTAWLAAELESEAWKCTFGRKERVWMQHILDEELERERECCRAEDLDGGWLIRRRRAGMGDVIGTARATKYHKARKRRDVEDSRAGLDRTWQRTTKVMGAVGKAQSQVCARLRSVPPRAQQQGPCSSYVRGKWIRAGPIT